MKTCKTLLAIVLAAVCGAAVAFGQVGIQTGVQPPGASYVQDGVPHYPPGPELKRQQEARQIQQVQLQLPGLPQTTPPASPQTLPLTGPVAPIQSALPGTQVQTTQAQQPVGVNPPPAAIPEEHTRTEVLREKFLGQAGEVWDHIAAVWNFVIIRGADGKALVTVGTLVGGLFLMGFGYVAAGMISRWIGKRLLARLGLNPTASAPLQKISYYVLLATFGMLTLNILNVPITAFSFAGGALAVGVGFGSQNIVNNFISGLILIAERPIRVGDTIEIDGRTGKVIEIGARSTRIATGANLEVIMPNSKFLESQVVNWTLTDDLISTSVRVGVSYGSPTREVERLLKQAASEHESIAQDPAPGVSFEDFADDALIFSVSFWLHLQSTSKGRVESDIRFRIDELFNEAGIVIAYPQRDVHLNMMRPLEVRLAPEASRELRRVA